MLCAADAHSIPGLHPPPPACTDVPLLQHNSIQGTPQAVSSTRAWTPPSSPPSHVCAGQQAVGSKHAAGQPQRTEGTPSLVTSIFPLELKWPDAPSLDMPTVEVLQGSEGADDIRVLHVDGHSMRLPSYLRF